MPLYDLNVSKLFSDLGGPAEMHRKLALAGYKNLPSVKGVQKWRERGKLSSCWLIALIALPTEGNGKPLDLREYLKERTGE